MAVVDWPSVDSVHIAVRLVDQVASVFEALKEQTERPLTVFVHTTLAPADARMIFSSAPASWRAFEAPVSGGPQGARQGSMTIFLAGPATTEAENKLLTDGSGRVFRMESYGQPALVKLLNNTLATHNLATTAKQSGKPESSWAPAPQPSNPERDVTTTTEVSRRRPLRMQPLRTGGQPWPDSTCRSGRARCVRAFRLCAS